MNYPEDELLDIESKTFPPVILIDSCFGSSCCTYLHSGRDCARPLILTPPCLKVFTGRLRCAVRHSLLLVLEPYLSPFVKGYRREKYSRKFNLKVI